MKLLIDFSHHPVLCRLQGLGHLRRHGCGDCGHRGANRLPGQAWQGQTRTVAPSLGVIVLFGGPPLLAHRRTFMVGSPPLLYWLMGSTLLIGQLFFRKNFIQET